MLIVFNQMISLFLLMLTGYLANRFGVIDKTFESKVSRFIVNISLPATILNAVTGSDMAHDRDPDHLYALWRRVCAACFDLHDDV